MGVVCPLGGGIFGFPSGAGRPARGCQGCLAAFAPCPVGQGARRAGGGALPVKGDSFRIKKIPLDNPKEKFWGRFDSAPRPLLRPKEGLRPFLWKPSRRVRGIPVRRTLGRGMGAGGLWGFGGFRLVGDAGGEGLVVLAPGLGGYCPARGRGAARGGRRALRVGAGRLHQPPWTGFAAGAAWRPGGWWGPPVGEGSGMGAFVPRPPSSGNSKKGPGPLLGFRRSQRKE